MLKAIRPLVLASKPKTRAVAFGAGLIGAVGSRSASAFYEQLTRPAWAPPAGLFGPVWSVLYLLMGTAAWMVTRQPPSPARFRFLVLYAVQLSLNAIWSWLFFQWRLGFWAVVDAVLLTFLVAWTMILARQLSRTAAWLLSPYMAWMGFAAVLTIVIVSLNPNR